MLRGAACAPVLVILALTVAACGGSSSPNAAAKERSQEQQDETKLADFAKCMREHGINAETATMPGGGHGLKVSPGKAGGGLQTMEAAQNACKRYAPDEGKRPNLSPQQKVEREEAVQKFARCMREHGIKVETSTHGGGIQISIHGHPGAGEGPNPESPVFQAAQKACQGLLPGPPGGGPPGKGPGPSTSTAKGGGGGQRFGLGVGG